MSLLNALLIERYDAFLDGVAGLDAGYRRCIAHIRALLPGVPQTLLNQRIRLTMFLLFNVASSRERPARGTLLLPFWSLPASNEDLLGCLERMLAWPASAESLQAFGAASALQEKGKPG